MTLRRESPARVRTGPVVLPMLVALAVVACQPTDSAVDTATTIEAADSVRIEQDAESAEDRIRTLRERSNAAIARQDVGAIVSFLDEEFQLTAGAGWFLRGRAEMGDAFARQFAEFEDVVYVRTPENVEASAAAPLAWETGSWVGTWATPEGPLRTGGRYAASWREVEGEWKIRSELFVTLFCDGERC